ncbi:NAD(P)H-hydrate dehydratase [Stieleria sp. TO1_6]|uniref:NAD(P)H-hydrate dehydratase n=1 Tax=Stieleria tagensis TaxID=2956795 RepID=UPI00209AB1B2|nr:NAD(P)H-hydrate dehydratase [Stieleria tagensis]MCO8123815.1 NAD(P)H-hydrate dehydratase [Stieleria tagensis]
MPESAAPLPFPARRPDSHKGDFGRVLLVGGSRGMAGSIALSSIAALKSGSGLVSVAIPDRCLETVAGFHAGIMTIPLADTDDGQFDLSAELPKSSRYDAYGCGPGMQTGAGAVRLVEALLQRRDTPRVMDADAINILAAQQMLDRPALPRRQPNLVLTPHPGELARLTGVPANDRDAQIDAAAELAATHDVTIVVKGGPTVVVGKPVAGQTVERFVNTTGNPGMATAGSGDVLTGIITSLLGQQLTAWDAARLGVFLHGLAGDLAADKYSQAAMTCWELIDSLPAAIRSV